MHRTIIYEYLDGTITKRVFTFATHLPTKKDSHPGNGVAVGG